MQTLLLFLLATLAAEAADWPRFRGPNGAGVGEAGALPVRFGPAENVAWKTKVPFGRSSPIVTGNRIFLTASEGSSLLTLAFDLTTGRELWRRPVQRAHQHKLYSANDTASPTPATDGKNLFVFFTDFGLVSYTFEGRERWLVPLGPFENFYGVSSSPVAAGGMVLLLADQANQRSFLLAVDAQTGKQRWKTARREAPEGWSIPIVHGDQIIAVGTTRVDSYFLATGESKWWFPLPSNGAMGSPVIFDGRLIVTASGSEQPWMPSFEATAAKLDTDKDGKLSVAESKNEKDWFEHFNWVDINHDAFIEAHEWNRARQFGVGEYGAVSLPLDGKGQLDSSAVRWRFKRSLPYVPAPVLYDGIFYMVKTGGIITALDPATGSIHKQGRTEKAPGEYFASPIAADGKLFLASEEGKVSVIKAGPQWEVLAVNNLEEECFATPAISGGRLIVRTRGTLYAFTNK